MVQMSWWKVLVVHFDQLKDEEERKSALCSEKRFEEKAKRCVEIELINYFL